MNPYHIYTHAVRAKEVLGILIRHGFGSLLQNIDAPPGWIGRIFPDPPPRQTIGERLRHVCEDLGPTFIKFGQIVSTRPDLVPAPLIEELKKLRTDVTAVDFEQIRPVLEDEMGKSLENIFSDIPKTPHASGSIAQVYCATTAKEQKTVALKIQRPGIQRAVHTDLVILSWLAQKLHESLEEVQPYDLPSLVEEMQTGIKQELDFTLEAYNAQYFNTHNPYPEKISAPSPLLEYTTKRVVCFEWVEATPLHKAKVTSQTGPQLAQTGGNSIFHQIVISGFFHGDPHSGNILIAPDHHIYLVDWGLTGHLTRNMRYFLADLFSGAAEQDAEALVRTISKVAEGKHAFDKQKLEKSINLVLRRYPEFRSGDESVGRLVIELIYILGQHGIPISRDYALLGKAITSIEEAASILDPHFDIREVAVDYLKQLRKERVAPQQLARDIWFNCESAARQFYSIPIHLRQLLYEIEKEKLTLPLRLEGLEHLHCALQRGTTRIALGLITAALIVGASLLMASDTGPYLFDMPALGVIGYTLALLLTFTLWWDARRKQ